VKKAMKSRTTLAVADITVLQLTPISLKKGAACLGLAVLLSLRKAVPDTEGEAMAIAAAAAVVAVDMTSWNMVAMVSRTLTYHSATVVRATHPLLDTVRAAVLKPVAQMASSSLSDKGENK
jgi:hypothetical protein